MAKWEADRRKAASEFEKWDATINELKVKAGKAGPEGKSEYTKLIRKLQAGRVGKRIPSNPFRLGHHRT